MIKRILKKICKWVFHIIMLLLVIIALISIKQDNQRKTEAIKSDPIHIMNDNVLKNHTGDTLYVSYDSREYDDYIVDKIIKDMNQRGYRVVNKYTEYLQYQELIGDIVTTREYTVTHVIYRD